jgi:hypothetical protein
VKPAHNTKTPQTATGSFAASRALLPVSGSGLSRIGPRAPLVSVLATVLGALAFMSSPALAAAPETPETLKPELETITETAATLRGVLNPHAAGELGGTYEFLYNASETKECKGGGSTTAGMVLGGEAEPVFQHVEGLSRQTEYAVCLVIHNQAKTAEAIGSAVTFLTGPPETPENEEVTDVTATSATLKATLNPHHEGEPGRYRFRYRRSASECEGQGGMELPDEFEQALIAQGDRSEMVEATLTGLLPNTTYTFCAWTRNEAFEGVTGAPVTFTTPASLPSITNESVSGVSSGEATVSAEINPGGLSSGYSVEYEPGKSTPEGLLPATGSPVRIRQRLTGLQPDTQYSYRFVAHNALGSTPGALETFDTATTFVSAGGGSSCVNATYEGFNPTLPDCRADELVSSASEVGEVYEPGGTNGREQDVTTARPFRAAASGNAVAYVADPGPLGGDGSTAKGRGNEYLAVRGAGSGPGGWEATNITPPVGPGENASDEREYQSLSPDLSTGAVISERPLIGADPSPQGPPRCNILYGVNDMSAVPTYAAFFTTTITPAFCGPFVSATASARGTALSFAGETADHRRRVFSSSAELVAPAVESFGFGGNVYESEAPSGSLAVVNILPDGEVEPHAVPGGPSEQPLNGPNVGDILAPDGNRVIWSSVIREESLKGENAAFPTALYAREDPFSESASTVQLDAAEAGAAGSGGGGQFWGASADGNKVFFTDCRQLTSDSTAVTEGSCFHMAGGEDLVKTGNDLYEYNYGSGGAPRLSDLTVDHDPSDPLGADVQGVLGTSEDGNYIYFVAGGALGAGTNDRGETPVSEKCEEATVGSQGLAEELSGRIVSGSGCNLFELHFDGTAWGAPRYIAKLSARDNAVTEKLNDPFGAGGELSGDWNSRLGSRTAEVTPDGRALVFSSIHDVTGYDTKAIGPLVAGQGGNEIFVYKTDTENVTCASCNPTGAPPAASIEASAEGYATYLPVSSQDTFMHRWMNSRGTEVFFDSSQPLVAGDSNGTQDVYEWEAEGTAGCPTATSRYGGCVFLLSGGESADFSFLADADERGENVFISHRGPLGGAGPRDDKVHLYDVRVLGGFSASSLACTGTGCQGVPPAAPSFATPASVTFTGVGNFPANNRESSPSKKATKKTVKCAKGKRLSRGKCVKAKGKKKKVKKVNHGKGSK